MGDHVEVMLRKVMAAMMTNDRALVDQVSQMDNSVDSLDEAIKLYVTKLTRGSLDEREGQAGDGDRLLRHQPRAYRRYHRQESERTRDQEDQAPLPVLARRRRGTVGVPQAHDGFAADRVRRLHVGRRQRGAQAAGREGGACATPSLPPPNGISTGCARAGPESIETTSLHLDVLRDLRRIHSHICSVAYPVLDAAGELAAYRSTEHELAAIPNGVAPSTPR